MSSSSKTSEGRTSSHRDSPGTKKVASRGKANLQRPKVSLDVVFEPNAIVFTPHEESILEAVDGYLLTEAQLDVCHPGSAVPLTGDQWIHLLQIYSQIPRELWKKHGALKFKPDTQR